MELTPITDVMGTALWRFTKNQTPSPLLLKAKIEAIDLTEGLTFLHGGNDEE